MCPSNRLRNAPVNDLRDLSSFQVRSPGGLVGYRAGPGVFLGKSIVEAAKMLLAARRQPLRNPDIATAFSAGGLVLNSKEPANTIGSVLGQRANDVGDIVKVGRGTWGLMEWYPGRSFGKKDAPKAGNSDKPDENSEVASVAVASIPFMITQAQRARLRDLGHTDEEIKEMTPDEAHGILGGSGHCLNI